MFKKTISTLLAALLLCSPAMAASCVSTPSGAGYDASVNYFKIMIHSATMGDYEALEAAATARNNKIIAEGLDYELISAEEFLERYEEFTGYALSDNCMDTMMACCVSGDVTGGREAEASRNLKIDTLGLDIQKIRFDDLYLLSRLIYAEAGSSWLSLEWRMMVGEVVLNRVASPEFPDTIYDCIYQRGQYSTAYRLSSILPSESAVEAAARLLCGERIINDPSVVFQSGTRQGSGVYAKLYDSILGTTYFCYSSHPELYK